MQLWHIPFMIYYPLWIYVYSEDDRRGIEESRRRGQASDRRTIIG
jgi:hypothetical protein